MKVTTYQLGDLRKADPTLYSYVLPVAHGVDGDVVEIDESKLVPLQRKLLMSWAAANGIHLEPPHDEKTCSGECGRDACFQKRAAENNTKEKERLDAKAAGARLLQYVNGGVAGFGRLRDNETNRSKWAEFEVKLPKDVRLSAALIDQFVSGWRSVLEFDAPKPTTASTPEPTVRLLPNGEPELAIDSDEATMRKSSIAQLRDLSKRRGEGKSWFNKAGRSAGNIDTGNQWQVR